MPELRLREPEQELTQGPAEYQQEVPQYAPTQESALGTAGRYAAGALREGAAVGLGGLGSVLGLPGGGDPVPTPEALEQMTAGEFPTPPKAAKILPTIDDVRDAITGAVEPVTGKGFFEPTSNPQKFINRLGTNLPFIGAAIATGGVGAGLGALGRAVAFEGGGAVVEALGGGPIAQFVGGLATGYGTELLKKGMTPSGIMEGLGKTEKKLFTEAKEIGRKVKGPTDSLKGDMGRIYSEIQSPTSGLKGATQREVAKEFKKVIGSVQNETSAARILKTKNHLSSLAKAERGGSTAQNYYRRAAGAMDEFATELGTKNDKFAKVWDKAKGVTTTIKGLQNADDFGRAATNAGIEDAILKGMVKSKYWMVTAIPRLGRKAKQVFGDKNVLTEMGKVVQSAVIGDKSLFLSNMKNLDRTMSAVGQQEKQRSKLGLRLREAS